MGQHISSQLWYLYLALLCCLLPKVMDDLYWAMGVLFKSLLISCVEKLKVFGIPHA